MNKIIIYTNETCPYCKQVKEELIKNNIEFENKITDENQEEMQRITNLTGMANVPIISCAEEFLAPGRDFGNPQHLVNILNNMSKSEYSYSQQAFERIKTLNHNMGIAFNRTNQILTQIESKLK